MIARRDFPFLANGETHREGIPLFHNGISRKIGPPPPLDIQAEIEKAGWPTAVLYADGELNKIHGAVHGQVSSRTASIGMCRLVPNWPELADDQRLKLWFLGRTEFAPARGGKDVAHSDDVYVSRSGPYGSKDTYLFLGFIGANRSRYTLDASKFLASGYNIESREWRELATEHGCI